MRLQRWISIGLLRGTVARRVGFPRNMKLQSKRSSKYCCKRTKWRIWSRGLNFGTFLLEGAGRLLVSPYSTVTDRNWRRKKKKLISIFFFPFMNKCNCTLSSKRVSTADGRPGLSLCVQCSLTSSCAVAAVNSHSSQAQLRQRLRGAIDTSHFLHCSLHSYIRVLSFKYTHKYIFVTVNHPSYVVPIRRFQVTNVHREAVNTVICLLNVADGNCAGWTVSPLGSHVAVSSRLRPKIILFSFHFLDKPSHSARGVWKCADYSGVFHFTEVTVNNLSCRGSRQLLSPPQ